MSTKSHPSNVSSGESFQDSHLNTVLIRFFFSVSLNMAMLEKVLYYVSVMTAEHTAWLQDLISF